ncbi:MAG: L-threonylcarbamoyladenylate synthase [Candidatus Micrarchaeia archaeon]
MITEIIKIDPLAPDVKSIKRAAEYIKNGKIVVFPTETVYGIGASVFNPMACKRIFEIKGRPADNPLIVHVSSLDMAKSLAYIPKEFEEAIKNVWPSPITFIAKAKEGLPDEVTAGLDTVALRMPAHKIALSLIENAGPIAAPSANPSKKPSATSGEHAILYFEGKAECIIDGGKSFFGVESTIINLENFEIIRPGPFTVEEIEGAFKRKPLVTSITRGVSSEIEGTPISPGIKYKHYAPKTDLFLYSGVLKELNDIIEQAQNEGIARQDRIAAIGSEEFCSGLKIKNENMIILGKANDLYMIAKNLYDSLIKIDKLNADFGIIEKYEEKGIGLAIMNRIRKATSHKEFSSYEGLKNLIRAAKQ